MRVRGTARDSVEEECEVCRRDSQCGVEDRRRPPATAGLTEGIRGGETNTFACVLVPYLIV